MTTWTVSATQWVLREPDAARAAARIAATGYTGVELSADPGTGAGALRRAALDNGLEVTSLCSMWSAERDCAHPDPALRRAAREYLVRSAELAGELGAPVVIVVPTYRTVPEDDRAGELARAADTIAGAAATIPAGGPALALEALNRYETHLIRTLDDAEALRAAIDHPHVRVMADLFHMHLEEDDTPAALRAHAGQLVHVHLADNQRREPGSGSLDFAAAFAALRDIRYPGALAMEFTPATDAGLLAGREHVERLMGAA